MSSSPVWFARARAGGIAGPRRCRILGWWALLVAVATACGSSDQPGRASSRTPDAAADIGSSDGGRGGGGGTDGEVGAAGTITAGGPADAATGGNGNAVNDAGSDVPAEGHPVSGDCVADPAVAPSGGQCVPLGNPGYACNPVTAEPCDVTGGQTCEYDGAGFVCQPLPTDVPAACLPCDYGASASCAAGLPCRGSLSRCTRYCCGDQDCGTGTHCTAQPPSAVGICQTTSGTALNSFGWNLPPPVDGGPDAAADATDDVAPPDCAGCSERFCPDRVQACAGDAACAVCLASTAPADSCYTLSAWAVLLFCRCQSCSDLCPGSCL
jgi:hypothetical protein